MQQNDVKRHITQNEAQMKLNETESLEEEKKMKEKREAIEKLRKDKEWYENFAAGLGKSLEPS